MNKNHLVGFLEETKIFEKLLRLNKFPHAILLSGEKSIGKRLFAEKLCEDITLDNFSKNENLASNFSKKDILTLFNNNTYPDHYYIAEEEDKKSISVEQIRSIIDSLSLKSYYPFGTTVIIDNADTMTISAANSLLKILEEPESNRYFILISSKAHLLPETIRSRVQDFICTPRTTSELKSILEFLLPNTTQNKINDILDLLNNSLEPLQLNQNSTEDIIINQTKILIDFKQRIKKILQIPASLQRQSQLIQFLKDEDKKNNLSQQKISLLAQELKQIITKPNSQNLEEFADLLYKIIQKNSDISIRHLDPETQLAALF